MEGEANQSQSISQSNIMSVNVLIAYSQLCWISHVVCMTNTTFLEQALYSQLSLMKRLLGKGVRS